MARSSVFETALTSDMTEKQDNVIRIDDSKPDAIKAMLDYVYTGKVSYIGDMAADVLQLADKYNLPGLMKICEAAAYIAIGAAAAYIAMARRPPTSPLARRPPTSPSTLRLEGFSFHSDLMMEDVVWKDSGSFRELMEETFLDEQQENGE